MTKKEKWKKHKEQMSNMRRKRRYKFRQTVREFRTMGFDVREITPYCFRFSDKIDIFPSNKRYHELATGKKGEIREQTAGEFLRAYFGLNGKNIKFEL